MKSKEVDLLIEERYSLTKDIQKLNDHKYNRIFIKVLNDYVGLNLNFQYNEALLEYAKKRIKEIDQLLNLKYED